MKVQVDPHLRGEENMARDLAMLDAAQPAVRLYGWRPWCVSLGRNQAPEDTVDLEIVKQEGMDLVERPTGGGAILHDTTEVTYAVVLPWGTGDLPRDLYESYRFLARPVQEALADLGHEVDEVEGKGGRDAFCYVREAGVSLALNGRKISGGAQRRTDRAVLQHGTVVLHQDPELMARLFRTPIDRVRAKTTCLADEADEPPERATVEAALRDRFQAFLEAL